MRRASHRHRTALLNVLLLLSDDHPTGATGAYGGPEGATPRLDALAAEGALFTNMFATTSSARPAAPPYSPAGTRTSTASSCCAS